jgi:hypothetical protein
MKKHRPRHDTGSDSLDVVRIKEEIDTIEKRLLQLGPDGDCGYENAIIRFYESQLGLRRQMLNGAD